VSAFPDFLVGLGLIALYVVLGCVVLGVLTVLRWAIPWAYYRWRARHRHARYVPAAYRRMGRVLAPHNVRVLRSSHRVGGVR
jgi:hypothetical protein